MVALLLSLASLWLTGCAATKAAGPMGRARIASLKSLTDKARAAGAD